MTKQNWIKKNHAELYTQLENVTRVLNDGDARQRMGLGDGTPQGDWYTGEFSLAYSEYCAAYKGWNNESLRNHRKIARFNTAEENMITLFKMLYLGFLKDNFFIKNEEMVDMGLPVKRGEKRKDAPVAPAPPYFDMETTVIRRIGIRFHDRLSKRRRRRPDGQCAAEIVWVIADGPTDEMARLVHSTTARRSPYVFEFDDEERGRYLVVALRWENTRGEKGPWSAVASSVIP
jgi:hypothetical protein